MVLGCFRAWVGKHVYVYPSTKILTPRKVPLDDRSAVDHHGYIYSLGRVRIGQSATGSYRSLTCAGTRDLNDPTIPLLKPSMVIGDNAWIALKPLSDQASSSVTEL